MSQENLSQQPQQQQYQLQQQHQLNAQQIYQNNNSAANIVANNTNAINSNNNSNNTNNNSNTSTNNTNNNYAVASIEREVNANNSEDIKQQYVKVAPQNQQQTQQQHQSVTISTQLQHEQLQKLQSQAANNLAIVTRPTAGTDMTNSSQSQASSVSTSSSNMITLTGAIPKDYESGEETEEENEVLEESPEGRWIKRNESVNQRDVPGIDQAFLAMDTEYGIEVVWNEINLLGGKKLRSSQDEVKIDLVFENLISLNHPNIVKFHKYWRDKNKKLPRIIFITEYMSSGSLKQFLRRAKRTNQPIKKSTWKRWCIQLLTALHYLHNSEPPIVHGNLSGETIFIQHNGLIKIGSIAPDIVNAHVKTCINNSWWTKNRHFMAPELHEIYNIDSNSNLTNNTTSNSTSLQVNYNNGQASFSSQNQSTTAVDIYSFGMVALEMFNLELGGNGDTHAVTPELIKQSIDTLDEKQRDFINQCLQKDPLKRPNAKELLFHPLLFEVPSLRLLAAHEIIKIQNEYGETNTERIFNDSDFRRDPDYVIASTNRFYNNEQVKIPNSGSNSSLKNNSSNKSLSSSASNSTSSSSNSLSSSPTLSQKSNSQQKQQHVSKFFDFKYSSLNQFEANKYLEDVKNGIYPLTAYGLNQPSQELVSEACDEKVTELNFVESNNVNTNDILPTSFNNEAASYNIIRTSLSPSSRSLSGTNTSLASTNLSSASSSSTTSPSQSLSQVVLQQGNNAQATAPQQSSSQQQQQAQQNQQQPVNQNFEHISYVKSSYSPPVGNLIINNNLMLNNISQAIQNSTLPPATQSQIELSLFEDQKSKKLLTDLDQEVVFGVPQQFSGTQYNNQTQTSSSNSSTAPTPTPVHQQQFFYNSDQNNLSKFTSPSTSPPPPQVQPYHNGHMPQNVTNGHRSLSKSPTRNNSSITNSNSQQNGNLNGQEINNSLDDLSSNLEWRHAEKMEFYLAFIEKYNNYQLSLNITFDDKTSRFVESQISNTDTANKLTDELIQYGLVSEVDKESLYNTLSKALSKRDSSNASDQANENLQMLNGNLNNQTFLNK